MPAAPDVPPPPAPDDGSEATAAAGDVPPDGAPPSDETAGDIDTTAAEEPSAPPKDPGHGGAGSGGAGSGGGVRRYAVVGAAMVAAALAAGVVAFVAAPGVKRPDPSTQCQYMRGTIQDSRMKRTWPHLYQCPIRPHTDVYEQARFGTKVGVLDTDPSWFICWTRGEPHSGGNDIWYYTQGDRAAQRPELDSWGYVPASELQTADHPDPVLTRECSGGARGTARPGG